VSKRLDSILHDGRKLDAHQAREVVELVRKSDGPDRALQQARDHAQRAREKLSQFERGDALPALESLADYVVTRKL
jgi:geranylgeranyl pyrophosphate synthase